MLRRNGEDIPFDDQTELVQGDQIKAIFDTPISITGNVATLKNDNYEGLVFVKNGSNLVIAMLTGVNDLPENDGKRAGIALYINRWSAEIQNYSGAPITELVFQAPAANQYLPQFNQIVGMVEYFQYPAFSVVTIAGKKCICTTDGKLVLSGNRYKNIDWDDSYPGVSPIYYNTNLNGWAVGEEMPDVPLSWNNDLKPYINEHGYEMWEDTDYIGAGIACIMNGKPYYITTAGYGYITRNLYCPPLPND